MSVFCVYIFGGRKGQNNYELAFTDVERNNALTYY